MAVFRYLRARAISLNSGAPYCAAAEVRFRATPGGADLTGTAIADSHYAPEGLVPANAFDGNINTKWANNGTGAGVTWFGIDLGVGVTSALGEVTWTSRNDGAWNQCPTYLYFEGSDDLASWSFIWEATASFTAQGQTLTFTIPAGPTNFRATQSPRLALLAAPGEVKIPQVARLTLGGVGVPKITQAARLTLLAQNVDARITQAARLTLTGGNAPRMIQVARLVLRSTAIGAVSDEPPVCTLW